MFCGKCGTKVEDYFAVCPNCGNKLKKEVNMKNKTNKNSLIGIATVIISLLLVIVLAGSVFTSSCEKTAKKYIDGYMTGDFKKVMKTINAKEMNTVVDAVIETEDIDYYDMKEALRQFGIPNDDVKDLSDAFYLIAEKSIEENKEYNDERYGDKWKYDININEIHEYDKDDVQLYKEELENNYDIQLKNIKKMASVEYTVNISDKKGNPCVDKNESLIMVKIGGKWYVEAASFLYDNVY